MSTEACIERLHARLARVAESNALREFDRSLESLRGDFTLDGMLNAFSSAARVLGRASLNADDETLPGPDAAVPLIGWSADIAGRALLLLALARWPDAPLEEAVVAAYRDGDTLEKLAVIRSLSLLPDGARFVPIALDAGRTNDARLFQALACDNPFVARHYSELEWNKLFMKAAFVRAPLDRMVGLARRENPELARMALDYVEEQESAGRTFPPEIWLGIAPFPPPGAIAKMLGYATHAVADVRLGALAGLFRARDRRSESFLRERLGVEPDDAVRVAIQHVLRALDANAERNVV
ncbi:MAG TPA: EboA domain-containing protein [Polyangiales bacterium]|nr:EboA domain-containing protein [Polyangiales bacterium]